MAAPEAWNGWPKPLDVGNGQVWSAETRTPPTTPRACRTPSTQILLWHTAMRPAAREGELGIGDLGLTAQADTVRAAIRDRFACPGPFGSQWAYETDGHRRHRRYHDANHLPTALAPLWGPVPTRRRPRLRHAGRAAPGDQATGWSATGSELVFGRC
jgi:hypothetical protein